MDTYRKIVDAQHAFVRTNIPASLEHRRKQLETLRELIVRNQDRLADAVYADLRRDHRTTIVWEIGGPLTEIDHCLRNLDKWAADEYVEKTLATAFDTPMIVREPYGVVLLISPWNYPVFTTLLPLVTIMAAGNTVVIKPSEVSPATSKLLHELFSTAFDERYIAVIQGGVDETTALLKQRFDHILYTGNGNVGRIVMKAAAEHLTPVVLELGGKCPVVVLSDADVEITAKRVAWGKFVNNGQTCIAPDYIICTPDVKSALITALQRAIHKFYGGDCRASKDYSRIVNERHFDRLKSIIDRTQARLLFKAGEPDRADLFIPPHIYEVSADNEDDPLMVDELFGPLLPILTVQSLEGAIEQVNAREKPLAAYIFTRDEHKVDKFIRETRSGAVTVNDVILHIGVDTLPFGGVGASGFGAYHGRFGFEQFSHKRAVLKRGFFGESLAACRYPPMTDKKFEQLKRLGTRRALPDFARDLLARWRSVLVIFVLGILLGVYSRNC